MTERINLKYAYCCLFTLSLRVTCFSPSIEKLSPLDLRQKYGLTDELARPARRRRNLIFTEIFNSNDDSSLANDKSEKIDDEFDFEAAFQKKLDKEGGVTGVKLKSTARTIADTTNSMTKGVSKVSNSLGKRYGPLDSDTGNFTMTSVILVLVLLAAGGILFSFALGAPVFDQPFETIP